MNVIKRAYHRLTGVLGYDYQGKPLRKGDLVEPAVSHVHVKDWAKCQHTVLGIEPDQEAYPGCVELLSSGGRLGCANPERLMKVEQKGEASWQAVEQATGWKPSVQKQEVEHG